MTNRYAPTQIDSDLRNAIIADYKTGIGIDRLVKSYPYGRDIIRRVLRESKIERMPAGNQVKFKPSCPTRKVCPACGIEKDKKEFGAHCGNKDGLRCQCKTCRANNERSGNLKRKYGITAEDYAKMHQAQQGRCACCGQPETAVHWKGKKRRLAIDHDHKTGKIRQLICHKCNVILGLALESTTILDNIKSYIERHKEE